MFCLFYSLLGILALGLDFLFGTQFKIGGEPAGNGWFSLIFTLMHIIPSIAVSVRRLHDTGKSGYWMLYPVLFYIPFIIGMFLILTMPIIGMVLAGIGIIGILILGIMILIFFCKDSHPEENQYGPSPKYNNNEENIEDDE